MFDSRRLQILAGDPVHTEVKHEARFWIMLLNGLGLASSFGNVAIIVGQPLPS
jgi:hypothetical protein